MKDLQELRAWLETKGPAFSPTSPLALIRGLLKDHDARQADPVPTPGDPTFMIYTLVDDVDKILENLDIGDRLLDEDFEAVSEEFDRVDVTLADYERRLQALEQSALSKAFSPKPEVQASSFMTYLNGEVHEEPEPDPEWVEMGNVFPTRAAAEKEVARRKVLTKLKALGAESEYPSEVRGFKIYRGGKVWRIVQSDDHTLGSLTFATESAAQHAIDVLGTELKVLLP